MGTLPLSHPDRQETNADYLWTLALCAAYRLARSRYSQTERMVKGFTIANAQKVTLLDNGTAEVASQFGTCTYVVNGACPCPDAQRHPGEHCKHRWAKALAKKATHLLADAVQAVMGETLGAQCPACGYPTVVDVPVWGKHRQEFATYRACMMALTSHGERYACGWREVSHA